MLRRLSLEIERVLGKIQGAHDIKNPTAGRLPMLRIKVRRDQLARYGIKASDVLDSVAALGGTTVGTVFEEDKRHPLRVRLPESWRNDPDKIGSIRVVDPQGRPIPLKDLAEIAEEEGPNEVERENVQHRAVVGVNVRGRDISSFVADAQAAIDAHFKIKFPPGYRVRWGGQFEHLQTASKRLMIVVPVAMLLIFLLLYGTFHSIRLSLLIYTAVPMAATGGVFALYLRGLPFSISAGVGFIALFGVAVLERPGLGQRRRAPAAGGSRAPRGRPRGGRRPAAADPHDGPGRRIWASSRWRSPSPPAPRFSAPWPRSSSAESSHPLF